MIEKIARHYGIDHQSRQAIEEMAELTQALTKFWKYTGTDGTVLKSLKSNISEEMADVEIMLDQLKILFQNAEEVGEIRAYKLTRQLERMDSSAHSKETRKELERR